MNLLDKLLGSKFKLVVNPQDYITTPTGESYLVVKDGNRIIVAFKDCDGNGFGKLPFNLAPASQSDFKWFCSKDSISHWKNIEKEISVHLLDRTVKKIEIIGDYRGAVIALLCYEYCTCNRPDAKIAGYGFRCPRAFYTLDKITPAVKKSFEGFNVIINGKDTYCYRPRLFGFKHVGTLMNIGVSHGKKADHDIASYLESIKVHDKAIRKAVFGKKK